MVYILEHKHEELLEQNVPVITNTAGGNASNTFHPQKCRVTSLQDCPLVLAPVEAARILGIGRNSIYALLRCGALRSIRVGKLIKIPRAALDEYLQSY